MHGHGEKPFLCTYSGCDRSTAGNGFPRHWNLRDHLRRVHNDSEAVQLGSPESTAGSLPLPRKRKVSRRVSRLSQNPVSYPEQSTNEFIDPSAIGSNQTLPQILPTQSTSNVGRLWPGMHQQQAALAKAQAQQKQQQQIIQQQRQAAMGGQSRAGSQRPRASHPPTDPIVEEKISQLLNSMRHNSVSTEDNDDKSPTLPRSRKDEEEMDEDERLLASEEGKKLSSKERRQLRNKVSARAFRSRRKGKNMIVIIIQQHQLTYL